LAAIGRCVNIPVRSPCPGLPPAVPSGQLIIRCQDAGTGGPGCVPGFHGSPVRGRSGCVPDRASRVQAPQGRRVAPSSLRAGREAGAGGSGPVIRGGSSCRRGFPQSVGLLLPKGVPAVRRAPPAEAGSRSPSGSSCRRGPAVRLAPPAEGGSRSPSGSSCRRGFPPVGGFSG
jgi:hypothetical protein